MKRRKRRETKYGAACVFLCTDMGAREVDEDGGCMACTMQSQGKKAKSCHAPFCRKRTKPSEKPAATVGAVHPRHRFEKHARVGVLRGCKDLVDLAALDT